MELVIEGALEELFLQDRRDFQPNNTHGLRLAGAGNDRRQIIPLDSAYFYLRHVELKLQPIDLFKICNCLQTIDVALTNSTHADVSTGRLTVRAWAEIRDRLFHLLIMSFPGRFVVCTGLESDSPVKRGADWPGKASIKFVPTKLSRPTEFYRQSVARLQPAVLHLLKAKFEKGEELIEPAEFTQLSTTPSREAASLLQKFYDICEDEAEKGKSSAHHMWCHLEAESKACSDRQQRKEIVRRMNRIQRLWGCPRL